MAEEIAMEGESLPPLDALRTILTFIVVMAGYRLLAYWLEIGSAFAGILLLFYLFTVEAGNVRAIPKAFIGAVGGLANGAVFVALPMVFPGIDPALTTMIGFVLVLMAIYCLLIGFFPTLFNQAYLLVFTVACIPSVLFDADFAGMLAALVLSSFYFGGILWGMDAIKKRKIMTNSTGVKPL